MTEAEHRSIGPRDALRALLYRAQTVRGFPTDNDMLMDEFLADWVVMSKIDYELDSLRQNEWQREAKLAFAVMVQSLAAVGEQLKTDIGSMVMAKAKEIFEFHGHDVDEALERFLP
ncbi:hypothetical protein SEA_SKYSAND_12 [Gordonia phage Skysand]|uniref:Uncharacterized protein n=1 Tax=Gordonia phage Skysand TaxID=2301559 RepID=A0A385DRJ8_9CAUD|nr:hypothetical protein KNU08_gp12 [Gordonia phage Skysand]AXQ62046.1 hypothetical protein SEA_SKYSAND_12 [Gordonia phage Skysand]